MKKKINYPKNRKIKSIEERFWAKVLKTDKCWLWQGAINENGYGVINIGRSVQVECEKSKSILIRVHRLSYELHFGEIGDGLDVCHTCDVRNCIRPDHLFEGTRKENMEDCKNKGRSLRVKSKTAVLNEDAVRDIRNRSKESQTALAEEFKVSVGLISAVILRKRWAHVVV